MRVVATIGSRERRRHANVCVERDVGGDPLPARNMVRLGNTVVTVIEGQVAYSFTSDSTKLLRVVAAALKSTVEGLKARLDALERTVATGTNRQ